MSKDRSGFTSNNFLIRFSIILLVYIVNRMLKVMRRMVVLVSKTSSEWEHPFHK